MSHQWDEIIYKNSGRLAKHQTYTGLEYVPRYKVNADKSIVCVENQILVATATLSNKELTPIVSGLQSNEPEQELKELEMDEEDDLENEPNDNDSNEQVE